MMCLKYFWSLPCLVALPLLWGTVAIPAERLATGAPPTDEIASLVQMLEHPDFAVREEASRRLLEQGAESISTLADAALASPPEAATRALHVLEKHLLSEQKSDYEKADDALQRLADSERGFAALRAANILSRYWMLREERAVAAIRELGGTVRFDVGDSSGLRWQGPALMRRDARVAITGLRPSVIVLRADWQGGIDGLKYLRRLSHREGLFLYVVRDSGVPIAEAEKLAATLPGLQVHERGAYTGISGRREEPPCIVGRVEPGGPASRAGLMKGDIIRRLDGEDVESFGDLVEKLKQRSAGDQVSMTIDRAAPNKRIRLTLQVKLGKWDLPELSDGAKQYLQNLSNREEAERLLQEVSPEENPVDEPRPEVFPPFEEK